MAASKPSPKKWFTVEIHRGVELAAKDSNGKSDPYLVVSTEVLPDGDAGLVKRLESGAHPKQGPKGEVIFKTLNPNWEYSWTFNVESALEKHLAIRVVVWDKDRLSSDDFMGQTLIPLSSEKCESKEIDLEQDDAKKHRVEGKIVVSFKGETVQIPETSKTSNLLDAIKEDDVAFIKQTLNSKNINKTYKEMGNNTSLHFACRQGSMNATKILLEMGADINALGNNDWTAFPVALAFGFLEIGKFLYSCGAKVSPKGSGEQHCFVTAAQLGHINVLKFLLSKGWSVESKALDDATAIVSAANFDQLDICKFLVEQGCKVDAADNEGLTALHRAAHKNNTSVAKFLLESGAPPNKKSKKGFTPAFVAQEYGNNSLKTMIMDKGGKLK